MYLTENEEKLITESIIKSDVSIIVDFFRCGNPFVVITELIPYYALFVQSFCEYSNAIIDDRESAMKIKDIRNKIKSFSKGFNKSKRRIISIDEMTDDFFSPKIHFLKPFRYYNNYGFSADKQRHIIANTYSIVDRLDLDLYDFDKISVQIKNTGEIIGRFIGSVYSSYYGNDYINSHVNECSAVEVPYYYDVNTDNFLKIIDNKYKKEINLFFLDLLCTANFTYYTLHQIMDKDNTWVFRVEYITTYYIYDALRRFKNFCDNNKVYDVDLAKLKSLLNLDYLFISKFRNCMMHYNLVGCSVLKKEFLDRPMYGLVESCFNGKNYSDYKVELHNYLLRIICYLEQELNFKDIEYKKYN